MAAVRPSNTSMNFYWTTRRHIPEDSIVMHLLKAFLGNGSVNTVNVQQWKIFQWTNYCALLGNNAPMKTLARNHVTCFLCGLPYVTIEVCFMCVVRAEAIHVWRGLENNTSSVQFSSVQFSVGDSHRNFVVEEDLTCELKTLCVIIKVILKVLQLFAVTSEDPINRLTNPNPRLSHSNTRQYFSKSLLWEPQVQQWNTNYWNTSVSIFIKIYRRVCGIHGKVHLSNYTNELSYETTWLKVGTTRLHFNWNLLIEVQQIRERFNSVHRKFRELGSTMNQYEWRPELPYNFLWQLN
jgi:hypothetical protein